MIILDNIIFSLQRTGGISVYWHELIKRLFLIEQEKLLFIEKKITYNIFRNQLELNENNMLYSSSSVPLLLERYKPIHIPKQVINNTTLFHSSYYRVPQQGGRCKQIVTVHDFTYEYFRTGFPQKVHIWQKRNAIQKADVIICVSENTKKDLLKFYPEFSNKRIEVVYNGVGDKFCLLNSRNFSKSILFVGGRLGYKNFNFTIEVLKRLPDYSLNIVGQPLSNEEWKLLNKKLEGRYQLFTNIDEEKLNELYNQTTCLMYPSSYEGFGIPVIEAMKAGCPVITLNNSSIPEVCGDAGLMIESLSIDEFVAGIKYIESNRDILIKKGIAQANKFSWDKCFQNTYKIYQSLY